MPLRSEDMPGPDHVEQATAAPGETRNVEVPAEVRDERGLCEKPVTVGGWVHPCDREAKHKGACSYRGQQA